MAESSTSKSNSSFEDAMLALFALLLLARVVEMFPQWLLMHTGIDLGAPYLVASASLTAETPIGTQVSALAGGGLFDMPGMGGTTTNSVAPGASLTIIGGPKSAVGGARWWEVEDKETGEHGWMPESALVRDGVGGLSPQTPLGTNVRVLAATTLWKLPASVEKVADIAKGARGTLAHGPVSRTGTRWWYLDQENSDDDGWLPESALVLASDTGWVAGSPVRALHDLDLFERPGGGQSLGRVAEGQALRVVSGPQSVGEEYWWLVETSDKTQGWVPEQALENGGFRGWVQGVVATILTIALVFTVLLVGGILYATIRTMQIRTREAKRIREAIPKNMTPMRSERWDQVLVHAASDNPNDWRLAIIEADIMLDELITRMGFLGNTLGDKLKQANRGDFKTLDAAWEAHRVRNQIAHEGSDFILTQRETKRIIGLYESVFDEFKFGE